MILFLALSAFALLSTALLIWQVVVASRFPFRRLKESPVAGPGVTVFKPLKGLDDQTRECLRSWLTQDYSGPVQILFGVASADDPVCGLVRELMAEHPDAKAELVLCPERLGANAKVSQLLQMERQARHPMICISDADVWAPRHLLTEALAPLQDVSVGLTHCFYQLTNEESFAMRWEAFAANVDFWSQVLQSASLKPVDFALGAAMTTTRRHLQTLGGFSALVDHLADDYQLGNRIARLGARVVFCPVVVECRSERMPFSEIWKHQLRWARTIRACQPLPFFGSILGNASLWPLLWLAFTPSKTSLAGAVACLLLRLRTAPWLEERLTGRRTASAWGMPLIKDLLQVAIWATAFAGRQITWRGVQYRVEPGGKLTPLPS